MNGTEDHSPSSERCPQQRAAVSFTGGKDCHLAWYMSRTEYDISGLVIFHPPNPVFRAHPLPWQELQAKAAGVPLYKYVIDPSLHQGDYRKAYAAAIQKLQKDAQIKVLITGDIDLVGNMKSNFLTDVCEKYVPTCKIVLPLWHQDRASLLGKMLRAGFDIRFSCVKSPYFDDSWIGRKLDKEVVEEFRNKDGLDLTGENGEYHTMVLGGPLYRTTSLQFITLSALELTGQRGQPNGQRWWVCDPKQTVLDIVEDMP